MSTRSSRIAQFVKRGQGQVNREILDSTLYLEIFTLLELINSILKACIVDLIMLYIFYDKTALNKLVLSISYP